MTDTSSNQPGYGQNPPQGAPYGQPGYGQQVPGGVPAQPVPPQVPQVQPGQFAQPNQGGYVPQPGYAQPGQFAQPPVPPRPRPQPIQGSKLDWLRDIGGVVLPLLALVMVWGFGYGDEGLEVRLTATVLAGLLTAIVAALGGILQLLVRFGLVSAPQQTLYLVRVGSQVPFVITVVVYLIIDAVRAMQAVTAYSHSGFNVDEHAVFGLGAGVAVALTGVALNVQSRDYELRAPQGNPYSLLVVKGFGWALPGLAAVGSVLAVVVAILTKAKVEEVAGGYIDINSTPIFFGMGAGVLLTAMIIVLPAVFALRGLEGARLALVGIGAAALLAVLLDGTFGLAFSIRGSETLLASIAGAGVPAVFAVSFALFFVAPLGALALSAELRSITEKSQPGAIDWFAAIGVSLQLLGGVALAVVLTAIGSFIPMYEDASDLKETTGLVVTLLVLALLIAGAAGYGSYLVRSTMQLPKSWQKQNPQLAGQPAALPQVPQLALLGVTGGIAVLGIVAMIIGLIEQRADGIDLASVIPAVYILAFFVLLPILLAIIVLAEPDLKKHFEASGTALPKQGLGGFGLAQPGQAAPQFAQAPQGGYAQPGYAQPGQFQGQPAAAPAPQAGYTQAQPAAPAAEQSATPAAQAPASQSGAEQAAPSAPYGQPQGASQATVPQYEAPAASQQEVPAAPAASVAPVAPQVDLPALARRAMEADVTPAELDAMREYRELWPYLAAAPAASPELLGWLAQTGDQTVLGYLRNRGYQV